MAATLHVARNEPAPNVHAGLYPQPLMADLDSRDSRYPTISSSQSRRSTNRQSPLLQDQSFDASSDLYRRSSDATNGPSGRSLAEQQPSLTSQVVPQGWASQGMLSVPSQSPEPPRGSISYALPNGTARRAAERYSLDEAGETQPPAASSETRQTGVDSNNNTPLSRSGTPQLTRGPSNSQDRPQSLLPSSPRHPSLPVAGIGSSSPPGTSNGQFPPIMPLAASPNYTPPVAPRNRAYPQQPTYITPTNSMNPVNPVYSPPQPAQPPPPPEEVCVECAMRDQEMADVDVTSPGVWERASDAAFEELKRRELEDEASGVINNDPSRPRIRGGRLTEQNLRLWLSINPKEPAARQQTVSKYVKSQRALLKEEAHARAQAMQEAKQLDSKVRDAYTQLRSSAYDLGSHAAFADDTGGVRIKPPKSTSPGGHSHNRSQSREITLLENGMIVEHVDVRREERERKRKEERRARKSSRSSAVDVTSIISVNSNGRHTDHGASLKPYSRYSQSSSARPISILTAPNERPELPRAYSQASFSDVHSLGSNSPKRRFFGFRNLSAGWRSQDSLAASAMTGGSLLDMHVALQRENSKTMRYNSGSPVDLNSPRRSQIWPPAEPESLDASTLPASKAKSESSKKTKVFTKFWRKVTGHKNDNTSNPDDQRSREKLEDDMPLAPPPPLSYLVDRGSPEMGMTGGRPTSTTSITSTAPKFGYASPGMSPPTAPSSALPSPVSSRPPGPGLDAVEIRGGLNGRFDDAEDIPEDGLPRIMETAKGLYSTTSVPDMRQVGIRSSSPLPPLPSPGLQPMQTAASTRREKSLPPIPPNEEPANDSTKRPGDRPRTVYTYDPRPLPPGTGPAHDFLPPNAPFRSPDVRRQSFGGLSSRPNVPSQVMYANGNTATYDPRRSFGPRYDEFGASRRSLGRIDNMQESLPPMPRPPQFLTKDTKRKSKFGLSTLLGKKNNKHQDHQHEKSAYLFPTMTDASQDEWCVNYATSNSRHSGLSMGSPGQYNPRISVASRKALEELVSQDSEFVAYRYPSHDQRLDLFR
ncbi:hypothetical protein D9756_005267 [Leucocoprinus leucothites]|uniref:Uncharacterized protein n=1 Tax=Leucocoprinus leucothites TaxID=201217 RepID=A0A8H5FZT7_9AGAR|nr:hypothetical protein D9756_005267 [Leucoagaricus leucothites]